MSYTRQREVPGECKRIAVPPPPPTMAARAQLAELPPRPGASPGLLRRRYSVPETIMRKYRLAQQRSDSEESGPGTSPSPASGSPARGSCSSLCEAAQASRGARREREHVRRSALLRRLWGRGCAGVCSCDSPATRSLAGSHAELRPLTSPSSSRHSHAGWATPKRQRLDSSREFRGSDEMIRAAMRNSYDRTEEARSDRLHRIELAESTFSERRTPCVDSTTDPLTDCDTPFDVRCERNGLVQYSETKTSNVAPMATEFDLRNDRPPSGLSAPRDDNSYAASSDQISTCTAKETTRSVPGRPSEISQSAHIDGRISERAVSVENDDNNLLPYNTPLAIDTPSYEVFEIVVSETSTANTMPAVKNNSLDNNNARISKVAQGSRQIGQDINIDEYVSNILVESLNSLTDQLECMNASIDRKINIVEKEIKVKLQNTGVNTIVHLSPTSNNQIIFGNEELYNDDCRKDASDDPRDGLDAVGIRDETASVESAPDNNRGSPSCGHDAVNEAVLQQIQKLFQDELNNLDAKTLYPPGEIPGISHIEISNVDVYIDNNSGATFGNGDAIEMHTRNADDLAELIGSIGTGNYYEDLENGATVPRFSAFPHTSSMEVNASSSDDADAGGSDCMSLVDSLDDPNSPRSLLLRRTYDINTRRSELVRSAIDVLDLLPEDALKDYDGGPKEKGESFFIRIKDDDCDCEKENVVVADHMPEKIRQRLYRRHRRRELRMECARRVRPAPPRRPTARLERDCRALVDALLDDLIVKIAHDEYKCMRIKQRASRMVSESGEKVSKKGSERDSRQVVEKEAFKVTRNRSVDTTRDRVPATKKSERRHIRGKLSLSTKPSAPPDDRGPKRIYQKSEIHEGNKCIEILEILEYVTGSRSSSETTNSDENCIHNCKVKKSRIPVPVDEKNQKYSKGRLQKNYWSERANSPAVVHREESENANSSAVGPPELSPENEPNRRALEPRSRSNSLRFRRVFDSIPEEKSSIGVDSSNEDINHNRRASVPNVIENLNYHRLDHNGNGRRRSVAARVDEWTGKGTTGTSTEKRSTGTSPPAKVEEQTRTLRLRSQMTMTSPQQRSAATSPMRSPRAPPPPAPPRPPRCARPPPGPKTTEVESPGRRRGNDGGPPASPDFEEDRRSEKNGGPERTTERSKGEARNRRVSKVSGISRSISMEEDNLRMRSVKLPEFKPPEAGGAAGGGGGCSDSSDSGGSVLCSLAPRWLAHTHRARRLRRRDAPPPAPPAPAEPPVASDTPRTDVTGGWSVTVAGSCRAALPADLEMRLRFPNEGGDARRPRPQPPPHRDHSSDQECCCGLCRRACRCGCACAPSPRRASLPAAPHPPQPPGKLTLTMKKEATDSSILASKSMKKSADPLPDLETYRASRSKTKSSVKTRRGYSLHCWLPDEERAPLRASNGLSVLGCAIIPELKPRVPTMSERDLTRAYTPRHYLRS